jgi:hypothetical protein
MLGAKWSPQLPLPTPLVGIYESFLSREIWVVSPSVSAAIEHLRLGASPSLLFWACCATSGPCDARVLAGRSAVVWCSRCVLGEVILGQPLAGRAGTTLPCHPDEHLGDGEYDSPLSLIFFFSFWPWSLANWSRSVSQTHRPCSVMLLTDASLI